MQISIVNGSVEYDGEPCLSQVDFCVRDREKIAVVGRNGCGKTTLLKALTGEVELIKGTGESEFGFFLTGAPQIGYLKQSQKDDEKTMEEEILSVYGEITDLEKRMEDALKRLENGDESYASLYSSLQEKFDFLGGYLYKKEYLTALKKFGFSDADLKKRLKEFSGGQRTKIALLKLLLSKPDVLILDEPTNHLDLPAVEWLEKYLADYKKSFVIVSHDRMFLDKTVNVVYEIEYGVTKRYSGNYTKFAEQKKADYERELKDVSYRKKEAERLMKVIERFRYKAGKAAMAQAKLKQLARLGDLTDPKAANETAFKGNFLPAKDPSREVLTLENLTFGYDVKKPLGTVSLRLERGQKLGIIGLNGCGKSTLVRTLNGLIPPLSGFYIYGANVETGYFDQTATQSFSSLSVLDDFKNEFPTLSDGEARTALGSFLFSGDDVFKTVGDLSGGEKVRLALCKIIRKKPNLLILDEPTNHMDIIGKETLETLLADYTGTVITVSHDRYFINKICDRLIIFEEDGIKVFEGSYSDYENSLKELPNEEFKVPKREKSEKKKFTTPLREIDRRRRRIEKLEVLLKSDEDKINSINEQLNSPDVYSDYIKVTELQEELERTEKESETLTEEWLTLQEELEELVNGKR